MYERFTDRCRKVMAMANQAAIDRNQETIGTEHILLALLNEGTGVGATVLKAIVGDLSNLRSVLENSMTAGAHKFDAKKLPLSDDAKKLIQDATEEGRSMNHNYVGTEHLLLGFLHQPDSVAAKALRHFDLSLNQLRKGVLDLLGC